MALAELFTDIADAIREKDGTTETIVANNFPARIQAIQTGIDTSDATATSADIASGKTAYINGQKVTGSVSVTQSGQTYHTQASTAEVSGVLGPDKQIYIQTSASISGDELIRSGGKVTTTALGENFGDAVAADVAAGKTFTSTAGLAVTGTLTASSPKTMKLSVRKSDKYNATVIYTDPSGHSVTAGIAMSASNAFFEFTVVGGSFFLIQSISASLDSNTTTGCNKVGSYYASNTYTMLFQLSETAPMATLALY